MKYSILMVFLFLGRVAFGAEIGFDLGASQSSKVGEFGGTNYYVGVDFSKELKEQMFYFFQLRGDSLGKDSAAVKKDRVSWMVGLGAEKEIVSGALGVGIVDTMTTFSFDPSKTVVDPFTGVTLSSDESGITHSVLAGYMGQLSVTLLKRDWGRLNLEVDYLGTFNDSPYGSYYSIGFRWGLPIK